MFYAFDDYRVSKLLQIDRFCTVNAGYSRLTMSSKTEELRKILQIRLYSLVVCETLVFGETCFLRLRGRDFSIFRVLYRQSIVFFIGKPIDMNF